MSKLLSANFARIWKNKIFWLGVLFMLSLAIYIMLSEAFSTSPQDVSSFDTLYFGYSQILGFCCAVFTSLFLGTEYSDGTIRNKIIVGHSRARIYLANLITIFVAMLIMMAAYLIGALIGIPFFGSWVNLPGCIMNFIVSIFTTAAFSAIFTLVAMLCTNKAVSAVISIILFLGLSAYTGNVNYEFIRDFLPTGHVMWVTGDYTSIFLLLSYVFTPLLGSTCITIALTSVGIIFFKKKDLK